MTTPSPVPSTRCEGLCAGRAALDPDRTSHGNVSTFAIGQANGLPSIVQSIHGIPCAVACAFHSQRATA